jgi:hypothetical protein
MEERSGCKVAVVTGADLVDEQQAREAYIDDHPEVIKRLPATSPPPSKQRSPAPWST